MTSSVFNEISEQKKHFFRQYTFAEIVRMGFALVFLGTGILKLLEPILDFADAVAAYDVLPLWSIHFVAVVFPVSELVVAALLMVPRFCRVGECFVGVLLLAFLFILIQAKVRGLDLDTCGCAGKYSGNTWFAIAGDSALLAFCGILSWRRRTQKNYETNGINEEKLLWLIVVLGTLAVSLAGAFAFNVLRAEPLAVFEKYKTKADRQAEQAATIGFKKFQNALALTRAKNAGANGLVDKAELEKIIAQDKSGENKGSENKGSGVLIIDARVDLFFERGHIQGAVNISTEHFGRDLANARVKIAAAKRLVVYCTDADCEAAEEVVKRLRKAGIKAQIAIYPGGWQEWHSVARVAKPAHAIRQSETE
jgi:rhodanese-related sulfurtransferase/uncharacterized membrane protein YphA (DoxX/SURF4 family)